jgi:hypothetical protein
MKLSKTLKFTVIVLLGCVGITVFAADSVTKESHKQIVTIGIWDQDVHSYENDAGQSIDKVVDYVEPTFQFNSGKWSVLEDHLEPQTWTIAFDGKSLGTCKSKESDHQIFKEYFNLHEVLGKIPHPDKAKKASWNQHPYRPLVLVSQPNYKDPSNWKPSQLKPEILKLVQAGFHKKYPTANNCKKSEQDLKKQAEAYRDSDIKIKKVYGSKDGEFLVEVALEKWGCDGINDDPFELQWFGVSSKGEVKFMSIRLTMIDAGDYDNNGKSELIFEDDSGGDNDNSGSYSIWDSNFNLLAKRVRLVH